MKNTHHISPLTLFIMTQALGDVKQAPPSVVLESEVELPNITSSTVLEPLMESKSFQNIQWESLYQQALLCGVQSSSRHPSLFDEQKSSSRALFIPCQEVMDWAHQTTSPNQAIVVDCSLSHAPSCFQAIHALKEKSLDVWVSGHPCSKGSTFDSTSLFSDDNLQKSSQLGFSWYFQSSDMEKINLLFEHSLPAWRFWFKHDQSRQWIWPFCDMIYYRLCEDYKTSPVAKPWIKDQRQRNSWSKLEERVYSHFLAIMGGEVVVSSFMRKALSLKKGQ